MIPLPGILGCLALAASSSSSSSSKFPPTSLDGRFQHCKAGSTTTSTGTSFPSWLEENFRRSGLAIADFALDNTNSNVDTTSTKEKKKKNDSNAFSSSSADNGSLFKIRGVQTLRDRQPGEKLLSVPRDCALTVHSVLDRYPRIRNAWERNCSINNNNRRRRSHDNKQVDNNKDEENHHVVEWTASQILALGVIALRQQDNDEYAAKKSNEEERNNKFIGTLPDQQYSVSLLPDTLKECLPPAYQRCVQGVQDYHGTVYQSVRDSLLLEEEEEQENGDKQGLTTQHPRTPTRDDFLWAIASTQSRSFAFVTPPTEDTKSGASAASAERYQQLQPRIMLPGIDLFNHKRGHGSNLTYNENDDQYEFRSSVHFRAGEEVTFSYGDDEGNLAFWLNFGFCIPGNPQRIASFDLDDILLVAQSIIPNIYPDPIIEMFKEQLREEGKLPSPTSLFEYDGTQQVPRPCLGQALSTVQALGEKLAEMPFPGLDAAILKKLLVKRQGELRASLNRLQAVAVPDGWQSMRSSIQTLLHDEFQTLSTLVSSDR